MFEYKFPDIGEGIHEGTLTKWLVNVGDHVKEGQDLAEIETDKMTTNLPSAAAGIVHKLHVPAYGTLEVGKVFITIDDGTSSGAAQTETAVESIAPAGNAPADAKEVPITGGPKDVDSGPKEKVEEEAGVVGTLISSQDELPPSDEGAAAVKPTTDKKKVLATPVARKLAKDLGLDIAQVPGTGPGGRILKEDIQQYATKKPTAEPVVKPVADEPVLTAIPQDAGSDERREPTTRIRKTIAERMTQSYHNLVHTTMIEEIDASNLVAFRQRMKPLVGEDVKLTYLPFIMKAIVVALKEFPIFNSTYDVEANEIVYKNRYNIGIATDTERGLVVPVVFDVNHKSIVDLANDIEAVAELARDNKLTLENLRGGTFTITNYGAIGGSIGTPIINFPESAILGIGRIQQKPVVKDGELAVGDVLPLSLSIDHRIIDGASGVRFLLRIAELLANPELLLLRS